MGFNLDPTFPSFPSPCFISTSEPLISNGYTTTDKKSDLKYEESDFWKQPDGLGYRPCLQFSDVYRKQSVDIVKDRSKYLIVVVNGGMNQQRNQIVDAVVIARILGAALVVPILQVNVIWGDERLVKLTIIVSFVVCSRHLDSMSSLYNQCRAFFLSLAF